MKFNRRFLSAVLAVCMMLGLIQGAFAAEISAEYGPAEYADIAASTYARMLLYKKGNGVVAAANESGLYGLVDLSGRVISDFQYKGMWVLDGGLFKFSNSTDPNNNTWNPDHSIQQGVIDSNGTVLLPMGNYQIQCRNKMISVYNYENNTTQYYTLDWEQGSSSVYWEENTVSSASTISYVSNPDALTAEDGQLLDDGVADFNANDTNLGVSPLADDWQGEYDEVQYLEDLGLYYVQNGKIIASEWGVVDADGNVLVPLHDGSRSLHWINPDNYVAVVVEGSGTEETVSYLLKDGALANMFEGRSVSVSVYHRSMVYTTGGNPKLYGLMDAEGNTVLEERFTSIHDSRYDDYWHTESLGSDGYTKYLGLYTDDGVCVLEDVYTTLQMIADERYLVRRDNKYGVMAVSGTDAKPIIPLEYDDYDLYGYQFNIFTKGNADVAYTLDGDVLMESEDKIDVFASELFGGSSSVEDAYYNLNRAKQYGYDDYNGNILPFVIRTSGTDSGYATYYVDIQTGNSTGYVPYRASNINEDGYFIYQDTNGKYGIGGTNGLPVGNPTLADGVKYVPYSCFLGNTLNGGYTGYEISSGVLPSGLTLNAKTGEISGVPMASGKFAFSVIIGTADGAAEYPLTLVIEDNTNTAVQKPNDYPITDPVGTPDPYDPNHFYKYDYLTENLRIDGPYFEFMRLLIDGKEKILNVEYEVHEGSTVITIYGETFETVGPGTHTIAAEFREGGKTDGTLKTVAQNYTIQMPSNPGSNNNYVPSANPTPKPENKPAVTSPSTPDSKPDTTRPSGFPFEDVRPSDWFYDDVKWAYERKMMTGVSDTRFAPEEDISQATIVTVLARLAEVDLTTFSEMNDDSTIESGKWYSEAAVWAKQSGLLPDYSTFMGEEKIPREQMAIMLVKYMQSLGVSTAQSDNVVEFADVDQMSSAGSAAFQTLYHAGIFKGVGNNRMDPNGMTSRAQFAALLHRISVFAQE